MTEPHVHVHKYEDGERRFEHSHPQPKTADDPLATRPHSHIDGRAIPWRPGAPNGHSHPHDHSRYR